MKEYVIGIDIGTSGTKTVLWNARGQAVSSATAEYPMAQPQNGWAEQDPADWHRATVETIRKVMRDTGVDPHALGGIGLSGQMHGLVMLDEKIGCYVRRSSGAISEPARNARRSKRRSEDSDAWRSRQIRC